MVGRGPSISRKSVHNCWLELMESAAVRLFWRSGCPETVPSAAGWWKKGVVWSVETRNDCDD